MKMNFFKMQAQGNDYLYFDFRQKKLPDIDYSDFAKHICDRHYGVGADGIVLILPSETTDAFMRIINADGSEAEMCGSALRSVCGYLGKSKSEANYRVDTLAGIKTGNVSFNQGRIKVKVDMGIPVLLDSHLRVADFTGAYVDMGNPHYVIFVESLPGIRIAEFAEMVRQTGYFTKGVNVEFVRIDEPSRVTVQVWERGSGATLACGTGACAVAFAAYKLKHCNPKLQIDLPGGFVETEYNQTSRHISLTGEVAYVFEGKYDW
jgi:diaminopimelate epimerase